MKNVLVLIGIIVVLGAVYLLAVEDVRTFEYRGIGGADGKFSFYDTLLIAFPVISIVLLAISVMAYRRKPDLKLMLMTFAFLMFTAEGILKLIINLFSGDFRVILVVIQFSEMLILISFLYAVVKK